MKIPDNDLILANLMTKKKKSQCGIGQGLDRRDHFIEQLQVLDILDDQDLRATIILKSFYIALDSNFSATL